MTLFKKIALVAAAAVVVPLSLVGCGSDEINNWRGKIVTVPGYAGE